MRLCVCLYQMWKIIMKSYLLRAVIVNCFSFFHDLVHVPGVAVVHKRIVRFSFLFWQIIWFRGRIGRNSSTWLHNFIRLDSNISIARNCWLSWSRERSRLASIRIHIFGRWCRTSLNTEIQKENKNINFNKMMRWKLLSLSIANITSLMISLIAAYLRIKKSSS